MKQQWDSNLYDKQHDFVAKYGQGIFSYLEAKKDEVILDLGCGTGDLTKKIAETGATMIGIDPSEPMITAAKSKFPTLDFRLMDARNIELEQGVDAIFSNAVLHWISEKEEVITQMYENLNKGGRIILEFGGKGNNETLLTGLRQSLIKRGYMEHAAIFPWYFPSIGGYSTALEQQGFRVVHAEHIDRWTPLTGKNGIKDWFIMFGAAFFKSISNQEKNEILEEVQENLRSTQFQNGTWYADYKRIRIKAIKE